jgi:hypothetical protein
MHGLIHNFGCNPTTAGFLDVCPNARVWVLVTGLALVKGGRHTEIRRNKTRQNPRKKEKNMGKRPQAKRRQAEKIIKRFLVSYGS